VRFSASFFFFFLAFQLSAQLTDDSTKLVYGPHTVKFTSESMVKNNIEDRYSNPDTTVYLFEKYDIVDRTNRKYQSLGFLGSPLFDLSFDLPDQPGRTFGFNAYDRYWRSVYDIKYYDTKSPFMDVSVTLGGQRRSKIDFAYSRNVNEHWNLGFDLNRITADKQIGPEALGDRSVESASFDIYTHYENDEKPYSIAFSFTSLKHQVSDIGGVLVGENPTLADYFQYSTSETQLDDAQTIDKRTRIHVYHQYKLGSGFQVYHQLDLTNQEYAFTDFSTDDIGDKYANYYPQFLLNEDTTQERANFRSFVNEAGLKGDIKGAFYRFYIKRRSLTYDYKEAVESVKGENFVGTYLRFDWKDQFAVIGNGELSDEGAYLLKGQLKSELLTVSYTSVRSLPSFLVQSYSGNHHDWNNSFEPTFSNYLEGKLNVKWMGIELRPTASVKTINNFIYFNSDQEPEQVSSALLMNRAGASLAFNFFRTNADEHFRIENEAHVTQVSGAERNVMRLPSLLYSGRLFWRGLWFQNAVPVEVGGDVYFRTSYMGNQYTPVISQFYLQNDLNLDAYAAVDLFINMKIRSLRATFKWTHVNQQANNGYFATPYYPGQGAIFDFSVTWLFFD